jgi:hypothetical protein
MSPSPLYHAVASDLRAAYDSGAVARSLSDRAPWKLREREAFLDRLRHEERRSLFEVGAGAGHDSQYFAANGTAGFRHTLWTFSISNFPPTHMTLPTQ